MDILSALQLINQSQGLKELGPDIAQRLEPLQQGFDKLQMRISDQLGTTKTEIDPGDSSEYKTIDREAYNERMGNIADTSAAMRAQMPTGPGLIDNRQLPMSPMQPAMNPYAPVNYGTMGQQTQSGGIGAVPSIEQILRALQSQQR